MDEGIIEDTAEECPCRCKVCGGHTHCTIEHHLASWHVIVEFVCADDREWLLRQAKEGLARGVEAGKVPVFALFMPQGTL